MSIARRLCVWVGALVLPVVPLVFNACGGKEVPEAERPAQDEVAYDENEWEANETTCAASDLNNLEAGSCQQFEIEVEEKRVAALVDAWKAGAPSDQKSLMEKIERELAAYRAADQSRVRIEHHDGTILHIAGGSQRSSITAHFLATVESLLIARHTIEPATIGAHDSLDADLNRVYAAVPKEFASYSSDDQKIRTMHAAEAKTAQTRWIKYRDLWAQLISSSASPDSAEAVARAMRASLTRTRVIELCVPAVAPDPPAYCPCYVPGRDYGEGCPEGGAGAAE